jgi:hypothetical protein
MDKEEDKQVKEVEVEEEVFMHINKEEIIIEIVEVINQEFPKFSLFIVKDLAIMKLIV